MNRRDVTNIAKKFGGKIILRSAKRTVFQFATEENMERFREQVSRYWDTFVGGQGEILEVPPITVIF